MVFQVRKTPLSSRNCGPGLGFRPQSHSPMVMGRVIDAITSGQLTQQDLLLDLFYLLLAAFGMYYLRYVWRMYILGTSYRLGQIMRSRLFEHFTKCLQPFIKPIGRGSDGTRNQRYQCLNPSRRWRCHVCGGCLYHGAGDLANHAFSISWQMTLVAICPYLSWLMQLVV